MSQPSLSVPVDAAPNDSAPDTTMLRAVKASALQTSPFEHIYMQNVFSPGFYERLLKLIPARERFHDLRHKDAMRADGSSARRRMYLYPEHLWRLPAEQRALCGSISRVLRSRDMQDAFKLKFRQSLETRFGRSIDQIDLYPIPILVCDLPGYQIGIHADVMAKAITVQFYLPRDASQRHIGTVFHYGRTGPEAEKTIAMDFMPASGYAFAVMERESWHSARRTTEADGERRTLMLTYYVQDTPKAWFKRRWDRFRTFFGLGPKG
ncbi:hypothetical protein NMQ14_18540 [Methyloversatilis sp. XJ19-13]|uniref:hypothetical protein n=1 Tax=Methyloversatilis sp. XJ19-13 TaxID=2963430 RepID=UPI00211B7991|nr:hypothetical protein [Methyloversatilis sp. XJ19-13]MCQ9376248.1 hypothetical protein [Methyloversatilis sp. XJ19-13]